VILLPVLLLWLLPFPSGNRKKRFRQARQR
jgi:hypothetical protein